MEDTPSFSVLTFANIGSSGLMYEVEPVEAVSSERPSFHKDDHGDRSNQKLRVQPFYQRDRSGKLKKW